MKYKERLSVDIGRLSPDKSRLSLDVAGEFRPSHFASFYWFIFIFIFIFYFFGGTTRL